MCLCWGLGFGVYQANSKEALNSAIRIMKESGAHAVKLEGGFSIVGMQQSNSFFVVCLCRL